MSEKSLKFLFSIESVIFDGVVYHLHASCKSVGPTNDMSARIIRHNCVSNIIEFIEFYRISRILGFFEKGRPKTPGNKIPPKFLILRGCKCYEHACYQSMGARNTISARAARLLTRGISWNSIEFYRISRIL